VTTGPTIIVALGVLLWASGAAAGTFYACAKRGADPYIVNEVSEVERLRREGWRCSIYLRTGAKSTSSDPSGTADSSSKPTAGTPTPPVVMAGAPDADRVRDYLPFVRAAAEKYSLPIAFILAVMKVESGFQRTAVSPAGAQGLMQVMPFNCHRLGIRDPFDAEQNIQGGTRLLRMLANRFEGDFVQVLSGYHAGGGAVDAKAGIPFEETNLYVKKVLDYYYHYKEYYAER